MSEYFKSSWCTCLKCPVARDQLSRHLMRVEDKVWIAPGLSVERDDNYNVMRGEETQLLGRWHCIPRRGMQCLAPTPNGRRLNSTFAWS